MVLSISIFASLLLWTRLGFWFRLDGETSPAPESLWRGRKHWLPAGFSALSVGNRAASGCRNLHQFYFPSVLGIEVVKHGRHYTENPWFNIVSGGSEYPAASLYGVGGVEHGLSDIEAMFYGSGVYHQIILSEVLWIIQVKDAFLAT